MGDRGFMNARAATHAVLLALRVSPCVALCVVVALRVARAPRRPWPKGLALLVLHARLEAVIGVPNVNVEGNGDGDGGGDDKEVMNKEDKEQGRARESEGDRRGRERARGREGRGSTSGCQTNVLGHA